VPGVMPRDGVSVCSSRTGRILQEINGRRGASKLCNISFNDAGQAKSKCCTIEIYRRGKIRDIMLTMTLIAMT